MAGESKQDHSDVHVNRPQFCLCSVIFKMRMITQPKPSQMLWDIFEIPMCRPGSDLHGCSFFTCIHATFSYGGEITRLRCMSQPKINQCSTSILHINIVFFNGCCQMVGCSMSIARVNFPTRISTFTRIVITYLLDPVTCETSHYLHMWAFCWLV